MNGSVTLPNGQTMWWEPNEVGGRRYYTDECAVGHLVWDTACTDVSTLLAAITKEYELNIKEHYERRKEQARPSRSREG